MLLFLSVSLPLTTKKNKDDCLTQRLQEWKLGGGHRCRSGPVLGDEDDAVPRAAHTGEQRSWCSGVPLGPLEHRGRTNWRVFSTSDLVTKKITHFSLGFVLSRHFLVCLVPTLTPAHAPPSCQHHMTLLFCAFTHTHTRTCTSDRHTHGQSSQEQCVLLMRGRHALFLHLSACWI